MSLSTQVYSGDILETFKENDQKAKRDFKVSIPGIIQSFEPVNLTCVVQPVIWALVPELGEPQEIKSENYPLLVDIPVIFPSGGGVTLTFPIQAGDECLLIFQDRLIDFWWQNGGIQEARPNQHDFNDAVCLVGLQSQARKISHISTSSCQLRSSDGQTLIELDPAGVIRLNAAEIQLTGRVQVNGGLTATDDIKASGISLQTHVHGGVESGGSQTQGPQ